MFESSSVINKKREQNKTLLDDEDDTLSFNTESKNIIYQPKASLASIFEDIYLQTINSEKVCKEEPTDINFSTDDNNEFLQSGTKWLKDIKPTFSTSFDKSTSAFNTPSTLRIFNTSITTVNELPDFKKKKIKYVRYGKTNFFFGIEMC